MPRGSAVSVFETCVVVASSASVELPLDSGMSAIRKAAFALSRPSRARFVSVLEELPHPPQERPAGLPLPCSHLVSVPGINAKTLGGFLLREPEPRALVDQLLGHRVRLRQWIVPDGHRIDAALRSDSLRLHLRVAIESEPKVEEGRRWHVEHGQTAAYSVTAKRVRNWCFAIALGIAVLLIVLWRAVP